MKIVTVIGARPQFIKAAAVSRKLRIDNQEILVHTGQHYDTNMSELFFRELDIPSPDYTLNIGSGSHGFQTASMLIKIEEILFKERPDCVLVYGDTNTTLSAALAASKIHIPVIHIEAGLRSYNFQMPEEQNRVLTDHLSTFLFCPTIQAKKNLNNENVHKNVFVVGDVMCDALKYYEKTINISNKEAFLHLKGMFDNIDEIKSWYIATIHRAENTDNKDKVLEILSTLESLDYKVIFPVHPRIRNYIYELMGVYKYNNILFVEPVGYLDMIYFLKNSVKVITDSGGLQKEAYILNVPCVTIRDQTEWIETLDGDLNILAKVKKEDILDKVLNIIPDYNKHKDYYGCGDAAEKICNILKSIQ